MLLLLAVGTVPVRASPLEELIGTDELTDSLPAEAEEYLRGVSPTNTSAETVFARLRAAAEQKAAEAFSSALKTAGVLLIVCVMIALANTLGMDERAPEFIVLAGVASLGAAALSDFDSYLNLGLASLQSIGDYSKVLLPVLASGAAMTGSAGSAAAKYAATALFMDVLLECARHIVAPCVCALSALSVADAAVGNNVLKAAKKFVRSLCTYLLTGLSLAFTAWLALSDVVAASADALTARMAKTAVSTALPVVGSILSDAAGTLAAAAGVLRGSVGLFGIAAVVGMCITPFLTLGARYLAYKLSAGLCSCVADKRLTTLVEDLGTCFGMILAINGAGALMLFISIYSLIRTVT